MTEGRRRSRPQRASQGAAHGLLAASASASALCDPMCGQTPARVYDGAMMPRLVEMPMIAVAMAAAFAMPRGATGARPPSGDLHIGNDEHRGDRLIAAMQPEDGVARLSTTPWVQRPSGLEILEVRGRIDGVDLAVPLLRALVDRHDDGRVRWMAPFVALPRQRPPEGWDVPRISAREAIARVDGSGGPDETTTATAELVAVSRGDSVRAVWQVELPVDLRDAGLRNPVYFVDAKDGAVSVAFDRVRHADVRAFRRNPVLDPAAEIFPLAFLDPDATMLSGPYYHALGCMAPDAGPSCVFADVMADPAGDFLFAEPDVSVPEDNEQPEDPFAVASVYHHADVFQAFGEQLGLPGLPCHAEGQVATLVANYKVYTDDGYIAIGNASYLGDCEVTAVFGQGPGADWGYDGDIVYHELTHGLIETRMGPDRSLGRARPRTEGVLVDAGAIGEAIADFVSAAITGDPVHGDYVAQYGGGQGRSADNDHTCPASLTGEVHFDSEPFTAALWEAHASVGDPLVVAVIDAVALMPEDVTFEEASMLVEEVTAASIGDAAAEIVGSAFAARGLHDCVRSVAWDALQRPLWLYPKSLQGLYAPMRPPPLQVTFAVPPDADRLRVDFDIEVLPSAGWEPVADVHALVKSGAPITFGYSDDGDTTIVDADPDQHLASVNDGMFELEVVPGDAVHLAFFNQGIHITRIDDIVATFATVPPDDGTSSAGGTDDDSGTSSAGSGDDRGPSGCGCTIRNRAPPSMLGGVWPMLILARRRAPCRGDPRGL